MKIALDGLDVGGYVVRTLSVHEDQLMVSNATTRGKDQRITVRISAAQRDLLTRASRTEETTLSEFILDAATTRAEDVLADRRLFTLDTPEYRAFLAVLDRPVQDKPRLRRLLAEPSVFGE